MKAKNKLTKEMPDISYSEFQTKFQKKSYSIGKSYSENNKPYYKSNKNPEADFYFELHWNLRHSGRGLKRKCARLMQPNKNISECLTGYIERM